MKRMKIAITGHTRGFGEYLYETLSLEHEVIGFSKSTGYDITNKSSRNKIIELSSECQIFINCAQQGFYQTELLYELFHEWKDEKKLIINIGSNSRDFTNRDVPYKYSVEKYALNSASKQLGRISKCKVTTVDFGYLVRESGTMIGYEDAYDYVDMAICSINKPHRVLEILVAHE